MPGGRPARLRRLRLGVGAAALTILAPLLAVSSATPAEAAPVVQQIVVVTVLPPGAVADGTTAAGLAATLNGPVRDFWQTQTGGAVDFTATAGSPDWVATSSCTPAMPIYDVQQAIGYVGGPDKHLLMYIPPGSGSAALPDCIADYDPHGSPSLVMSGDRFFTRNSSAAALAHQIGHSLGLRDVGIDQYTPGDRGPSQFGIADRQDPYDVMGSAPELGALSATEELALGLLPPEEIHDVPSVRGSYDVALSPWAGTGGTKVLRLTSDETLTFPVLLEYRAPVEADSWLDSAQNTHGVQSGVVVEEPDGQFPEVIDSSPSEGTQWASDRQLALTTGTSTRVGPRVTFTVRSMTASQAVVRVVVDEPDFPRDLDRNGLADLIAAGPDGVLYKYPAKIGPPDAGMIGPRVVIGRGWQARDLITVAGGWQGTGAPEDVLARDRANGDLWMYPGNGHGGLSAGHVIGHGWQVMTALFSPGDWDGDGNADLVGRRNDGTLFLYPGNGAGGFGTVRKIGQGWNAMTAFVMTGSSTLTSPDFFARSSDGTLWLYVGDGHGGFLGRRAVGHGWQSFQALTGVGDWDHDGDPDVLASSTVDGEIFIYYGYGNNDPALGARDQLGRGWNGYRVAS